MLKRPCCLSKLGGRSRIVVCRSTPSTRTRNTASVCYRYICDITGMPNKWAGSTTARDIIVDTTLVTEISQDYQGFSSRIAKSRCTKRSPDRLVGLGT